MSKIETALIKGLSVLCFLNVEILSTYRVYLVAETSGLAWRYLGARNYEPYPQIPISTKFDTEDYEKHLKTASSIPLAYLMLWLRNPYLHIRILYRYQHWWIALNSDENNKIKLNGQFWYMWEGSRNLGKI